MNSPHQCIRHQYRAIIQYAPDEDTTNELYKYEKTKVQQIVVTMLYYDQAVVFIVLKSINTISEQQPDPTERTAEDITQLLYYEATQPNSVVR